MNLLSFRSIRRAVLMLTVLVRVGCAQCSGNWMNPGYSLYAPVSMDGTYLYTTTEVDGTTYGNCPSGCGSTCQYGTHTPIANNVISWSGGSVGGTTAGPRQVWNSYISYQNNQQVAWTDGTDYTVTTEARVACNVAFIIIWDMYLQSVVHAQTVFTRLAFNNDNWTCSQAFIAQCGGTPACGYPQHLTAPAYPPHCNGNLTPDYFPGDIIDCRAGQNPTTGAWQPPDGLWGFDVVKACLYVGNTIITCSGVTDRPDTQTELIAPSTPANTPGRCTVNRVTN